MRSGLNEVLVSSLEVFAVGFCSEFLNVRLPDEFDEVSTLLLAGVVSQGLLERVNTLRLPFEQLEQEVLDLLDFSELWLVGVYDFRLPRVRHLFYF